MSSGPKKPSPSKPMISRSSTMPPNPPRSPLSRGSSSSTVTANGLARGPSIRAGGTATSRPAKRTPNNSNFLNSNSNVSDDASEEDARAENVSIMEELTSQVRKAETAAEEYQRQLNILQTRLDDSLSYQAKLEDQVVEAKGKMEDLEKDFTSESRQRREIEGCFEAERAAFISDISEQKAREAELESTILRLKESLSQRELRAAFDEENGSLRSPTSRGRSSPGTANDQFAPPPTLLRSDSRTNSNFLMQKDKIIETLRLELAEAQIKNMELANAGGGRMHDLEKALLETRITNARLMEDNESFQLLLSEKTLSGDFSKTDFMHTRGKLGSLAEELESAEGESENYRRLEVEAKALKDQNKALTLYIENIIGRLLQHSEFENILDKTPDLMSGAARPPPPSNTDKELPPPPAPSVKDEEPAPSMLQRARSVVGGAGRRSRPVSLVPTTAPVPSIPNEDHSKAPSVPLSRSQSVRTSSAHRRSQSELPFTPPLVNQMYRGPPSTGSGGSMMSPGFSPSVVTPRSSYFAPSNLPNSSSRAPSASRMNQEMTGSSSNSTFSDHSGDASHSTSPPRNNAVPNNYTGAVMTQSKLRPLRLVQENQEVEGGSQEAGVTKQESEADMAARKKANRSSWIPGWMNRGAGAKSEDGLQSPVA